MKCSMRGQQVELNAREIVLRQVRATYPKGNVRPECLDNGAICLVIPLSQRAYRRDFVWPVRPPRAGCGEGFARLSGFGRADRRRWNSMLGNSRLTKHEPASRCAGRNRPGARRGG